MMLYEGLPPSATVRLIDISLIAFGQQLSSMAPRRIHQALDTQRMLVSSIHALLVWSFHGICWLKEKQKTSADFVKLCIKLSKLVANMTAESLTNFHKQ